MEKPKLLVVAGPNGSGKTFVTGKILKHEWTEGCEYVNPDIIARNMFGDWNSPEAVLKAAQYATERREACIAERRGLIFETVLSAPDKVSFIEKAKATGYFVRLFFICTDNPCINASRIVTRVIDGGHDVPIPKIISRYAKSIANCAALAGVVDRLYVYDNSIDNRFPELLFRSRDGKPAKRYAEIREWAAIIYEASSE